MVVIAGVVDQICRRMDTGVSLVAPATHLFFFSRSCIITTAIYGPSTVRTALIKTTEIEAMSHSVCYLTSVVGCM